MTQRTLIRGGWIVRTDESDADLPHGDLLIEDGTIAAIGPSLAADGAETIDASGMLVLPGFVDTHRHTWQTTLRHRGGDWSLDDYFAQARIAAGQRTRPEDVYAGTLFGALTAIDSGITTLLDWSHIQNSPAHADAAVAALAESGLRAVFGHGGASIETPQGTDPAAQRHSVDIRRLRRERFTSDDGLLTLAMAATGPDYSSDVATAEDFALARELGIRITAHVATREPGPENRGIERMHAAGLLGPDITVVHGGGATDHALKLLADHGVTVSVSAQIELGMDGLAVPVLGRMLAAGLTPSLSVDSETATAGDMFTQMRTAFAIARRDRFEGRNARVSTRDVLRWATLQGARATGLEHRTGSLTAGKAADIILIRATDVNLAPVSSPTDAIVLAAHPGNVDTVLVAGRVLKRGGRLHADLDRARRLVQASHEHVLGS
ncbi:amidohydrolase family protein [Pendulispora brunnea]|uniref:Amidohydrolase family protein n=1 Tax=Pendulispora brunnea TaxID=2905690 RepID=A0ABZ2JZE7_9BACT